MQATVPAPIITQQPVISAPMATTPITVVRAAVSNATFTSSAWLKNGVVILSHQQLSQQKLKYKSAKCSRAMHRR